MANVAVEHGVPPGETGNRQTGVLVKTRNAIVLISGVAVMAAQFVVPSALGQAQAGKGCKSSEVGKTSGSLTCKRIRGKTVWTAAAVAKAPQVVATSPVTTVPADDLDRTATLRFSYQVGPTSWDPAKMSSSFDTPTAFLIYDRLVHLSPNAEPIPGLASKWEFGDGGKTLTFTLRTDVKFHDGTPFNAEAAKLNLERNKKGTSAGELAPVASIDAVNPTTLRLNLSAPGGALPGILSDRAGVMASPKGFETPAAIAALDLKPIGSGMYRLTDFVKDQKIVGERFADYWDKPAQGAAKIEVTILTDNNARANALKSGAVDLANLEPCQVDDAEKAGFIVTKGLSLNLHHLQFNRSKPFLNKKEVRQALAMAVNRDAIVTSALCGYGAPSVQNFPPGYYAYNPNLSLTKYPFNPAKASEILRAQGVPDNWTLDVVVPNLPVYITAAQALKDQLGFAGVNLAIRPVDPVQTAPIFYVQKSGDALISVFGGRADPAQLLNSLFTAGPLQNPGAHTTPKVVELISAANEPGGTAARGAAMQAASAEVLDESLNIVLYHTMVPLAYNKKVKGTQIWLGGKVELRGVGIAR
jgi:peptide/nickel transport system substrate-binding protein